MRTRCSERQASLQYVVFVTACTWMASNSCGDFSWCRNILKIWRKDGPSALLNCRKLLRAFFTPPFTLDSLRARGRRGTCEGPPQYKSPSIQVPLNISWSLALCFRALCKGLESTSKCKINNLLWVQVTHLVWDLIKQLTLFLNTSSSKGIKNDLSKFHPWS